MSRTLIYMLAMLPMIAFSAEEKPLGRLFLTPAERASLDSVRQNSRPPEKIVTPGNPDQDEDIVETAAPPPVVTVQGYVKRSDGKGTVWVNGRPVQEKASTKDVEIGKLQGKSNEVQVKLPSTGQTVKLKAGQSYDPASGKVGSLREIAPVAEIPSATSAPEKAAAESAKTTLPVPATTAPAAPK